MASSICPADPPVVLKTTVPVDPVPFGVVLYPQLASSLAAAFCLRVNPVADHVPPIQLASPTTCHAWLVTIVIAFVVMDPAPVLLFVVPTASIGVVLSTPVNPRTTTPKSPDADPPRVNVRFATDPNAHHPPKNTSFPDPSVTWNAVEIAVHPDGADHVVPPLKLPDPAPKMAHTTSVEVFPAGSVTAWVVPGL